VPDGRSKCIPIFGSSEVSEESVRGMLRRLIEQTGMRRGTHPRQKCVTLTLFFSRAHGLMCHPPTSESIVQALCAARRSKVRQKSTVFAGDAKLGNTGLTKRELEKERVYLNLSRLSTQEQTCSCIFYTTLGLFRTSRATRTNEQNNLREGCIGYLGYPFEKMRHGGHYHVLFRSSDTSSR
jgi:hypothetical protein